jgi:hypothetical protein
MKHLLIVLTLLTALTLPALAAEKGAKKAAKGRLHHVVAFKFKEEATKAQIKEVEQAFAALKKKITAVKRLDWGTNVSPEKLDKGFTHCFVLTFTSEQDRDVYLKHPDHEAFVKLVGPAVGDVFVVDFWAK